MCVLEFLKAKNTDVGLKPSELWCAFVVANNLDGVPELEFLISSSKSKAYFFGKYVRVPVKYGL